ncbi:MAG: MFS transporter [Desulfobulbaceae bacterium]|nr:MFS transporter [Desulfobulbaceae bacterium]HIJ79064.1 MFS transporter [Deltaproteobacteria bacterium]
MKKNADYQQRTIFSWCLYDWGNSAFTTLVVTFVYATYFSREIVGNPIAGTRLWSWGIGISALAVALLAPILGGISDRSGKRRAALITASLICIAATVLLALIRPAMAQAPLVALSLFIVGNTAYELGIVFYNAYLPEIAPPEKIGRISGYGWGLGYVGGILSLALALLMMSPKTPLSAIGAYFEFDFRYTNLLVAAWFLLFSLPLFFMAPPGKKKLTTPEAKIPLIKKISRTLTVLREHPEVVKLLAAHLLYNDGLVTIFAFGGIYAAGTFGMGYTEVMLFGIVLNIAAGIGALVFGLVDDLIGGKKTVVASIIALFIATFLAVIAPDKTIFWIAGIIIGIFAGPNQAASRSLMGRLTPAAHRTQFFGFFTLSGKITSFLGPIILGLATSYYQNQRAGVATILFFFFGGALLMIPLKETKDVD